MAKKSIQDFYAYFVDTLQADLLLHYLRDKKWLTPDECDTLKSGQMTRRQKVEKILLLLPRKSTSSFDGEKILVECIIWSGQQDLARKLGYNDYEINEISTRNPSATNPVQDSKLHTFIAHVCKQWLFIMNWVHACVVSQTIFLLQAKEGIPWPCVCKLCYSTEISYLSLAPGHGYADAGVHMGYTGQASHMGYANHGAHYMGHAGQGNHMGYTQTGYGQPQHNTGAVGIHHGGATGYSGSGT